MPTVNYITVRGIKVPVHSGESSVEAMIKFSKINGIKYPEVKEVINANGNPRIIKLFNKMKPYDNSIMTLKKVNGRMTSVPKDKKQQAKYISLVKKMDRELIRDPSASREITWDSLYGTLKLMKVF